MSEEPKKVLSLEYSVNLMIGKDIDESIELTFFHAGMNYESAQGAFSYIVLIENKSFENFPEVIGPFRVPFGELKNLTSLTEALYMEAEEASKSMVFGNQKLKVTFSQKLRAPFFYWKADGDYHLTLEQGPSKISVPCFRQQLIMIGRSIEFLTRHEPSLRGCAYSSEVKDKKCPTCNQELPLPPDTWAKI